MSRRATHRLGASIVALSMCIGLTAPAVAKPAHAPARRACCLAPAGTVVQVELVDPVSTKTQKTGDSFQFRLTQPVVVRGQVVLKAGLTGVGEVVDASKPGLGGKAAKLVLAARYLDDHGRHIPLEGLQLSQSGKANVMAAQAVGLTGIAFGPLGLIGFAVKGDDASFAAGTTALVKTAAAVTLPPLGRAPRGLRPVAEPVAEAGAIQIPAPPAGEGQVVFFRPKTILGTGQWFNVRENGQALGRLDNGVYFVQPVTPGLHTYTAKTEPEFSDQLKLQVDAGETYFVEGELTKGVIIGAADLSPSSRDAFEKAAKALKPVEAPAQAKAADAPADKPAATSAPGPAG